MGDIVGDSEVCSWFEECFCGKDYIDTIVLKKVCLAHEPFGAGTISQRDELLLRRLSEAVTSVEAAEVWCALLTKMCAGAALLLFLLPRLRVRRQLRVVTVLYQFSLPTLSNPSKPFPTI
ncbi:hypothetical protein C0J52_27092 [Blattella germanica]|nr:hypothetical protein C0J52_27092 [Blattella germanica]